MGGELERVARDGAQRGVVDIDARAAVVKDMRGLAGGQPEVDRAADRAEAVAGQVQQRELGPVGELKEDDVAPADAGGGQAGGEPLDLLAELGVGPAPARRRIVQRRPSRVAVRVARDAGGVREVPLDEDAVRARVVGVARWAAHVVSPVSAPVGRTSDRLLAVSVSCAIG
jgi:hypothetical protein